MSIFIGIDGFRLGWVAVWIDECGRQGFDYSHSLLRLLSYPHARVMIDIPIGLPERGDRACDRQAQQFLGASVFTGARRGLLKFETQAEANEYYRRKSEVMHFHAALVP